MNSYEMKKYLRKLKPEKFKVNSKIRKKIEEIHKLNLSELIET